MYSTVKFVIKPNDELYEYCDKATNAANNLKNATLFRVRQVLTMFSKEEKDWSTNEKEIYKELKYYLPQMGAKYTMPCKGKTFLSYQFLNALMVKSKNPDYINNNISRHGAQHVLKEVSRDMKSFYALLRMYKKDPKSLPGKPNLPKYCKKGGNHTVKLSNQEVKIYDVPGKTDCHYIHLPLTKIKYSVKATPIKGRLKEASIVPYHNVFGLILVLDDGKAMPEKKDISRICAIDMGINNFAAITNNIGVPSLLFKGGIIKSINQYCNKRMRKIRSVQTAGTTNKFKMTDKAHKVCLKRNNQIADFMSKIANKIVNWCVQNNIDTIVIGKNTGWKTETNLGKVNNQNFVQIPFNNFVSQIKYRADDHGISVIEQEESYTSKASFLSKDPIPVYEPDSAKSYVFSGKRVKRGLYKEKDGTIINADLNGSANILRKAFQAAFDFTRPEFDDVYIYVHPDLKPIHKSNPSGIRLVNSRC